MSSPELIVAQALVEAHRQHHAVDATAFSELLQQPEEAYAVQAAVAQALDWFDQPVPRHWKSGGPSRDHALTHAALPPHRVWASPADAHSAHFNLYRIEVEIALRLAREVTPQDALAIDTTSAQRWLDGMAVSIEMVDSRWQPASQPGPLLKLADLQSNGALVLGAWQPYAPRDWSQQTCTVQIGSAAPQAFRGTHSLQDPAWLLPTWLRHVTRHGATVPSGTVVTTGTWCGLMQAARGDRVRAAFDGIGEAEVQL